MRQYWATKRAFEVKAQRKTASKAMKTAKTVSLNHVVAQSCQLSNDRTSFGCASLGPNAEAQGIAQAARSPSANWWPTPFTPDWPHRKLARNVIADRITHMRSHRI
jgi:hypothetical protein